MKFSLKRHKKKVELLFFSLYLNLSKDQDVWNKRVMLLEENLTTNK